MTSVEDDYLNLYGEVLDNSEFAAGTPGKRYEFDSATWAVSLLSSMLTIIGTGYLSALGKSLADSNKNLLKRVAAKVRRPTHESNVEKLTEIRRITIELSTADPEFSMPPVVQQAIAAELAKAGLDAARSADIAAKVTRAVISGRQE